MSKIRKETESIYEYLFITLPVPLLMQLAIVYISGCVGIPPILS